MNEQVLFKDVYCNPLKLFTTIRSSSNLSSPTVCNNNMTNTFSLYLQWELALLFVFNFLLSVLRICKDGFDF